MSTKIHDVGIEKRGQIKHIFSHFKRTKHAITLSVTTKSMFIHNKRNPLKVGSMTDLFSKFDHLMASQKANLMKLYNLNEVHNHSDRFTVRGISCCTTANASQI